MKALVTGGAGYIGSILVSRLIDSGYEVNVLDDLSTGHRESVNKKARFFHGSILDKSEILPALDGVQIVFHLAAKTLVEESVRKPQHYFNTNAEGTKILIETMLENRIYQLIFASTCSVYKNIDTEINENSEVLPKNPYGKSKLAADNLIEEFCQSTPLQALIFRFFNVYGEYEINQFEKLEEKHQPETHLIPIVIETIKKNGEIPVYGFNWDTPDGTCIRDYLHVTDLSEACLIASQRIANIKFEIINLGTGIGHSVLSVISSMERKLNMNAKINFQNKRAGDAKRLVADINKAKEVLGWSPKNML